MKRYDWTPDGMAQRADGVHVRAVDAEELQHRLAEVTQQRDTALAALGEVQAAAREMMLAADNLLREREGYRAACALADQLRKKGSGL